MNCFHADCPDPVFFEFTWGWGEKAACCRGHQVHAQQVHDSQERGRIAFSPIDPNAEIVPLARDERTRLIAAQMSAEQEADETKVRAAQLYNLNTELQAEVRRLRARNQEAYLQLKDRAADLERLATERDEALADLADAQTELERIKMLIPREAPETPVARV